MSQTHWLALASISGLGGVTARRLVEQFGSVEDVFHASLEELTAIPRVTEDVADQIRRAPLEQLQADLYALSEEEIEFLTWDDARFPRRLRDLPDVPVALFMRGHLRREDDFAVAIVGTREATAESAERATILARELAVRGLTIVSGLALGIDTAAHRGALDAEDGRTIGVLGSGIRVIHPRENAELAERITRHGALVSELGPNAPPRGPQLMARDRLVSGLSQAVIVVQAGEKSGSLDTAARARKQRRGVYAIPASPGTDRLLRGGATLLEWTEVDFDHLAEMIRTGADISQDGATQQLTLL
ncbi:MAG: DNA-processing protein DprA [Chloroflexi bacterium]|nr:DNA-processing protein DprA [Chloroflexota bacterium]